MAGQANSLISHGSLVGTIKTSNAATNSLVGRLNVDNTITGRMDTSSLTGALDTDNAITSQSGSISTDDQMIGVLNANNTIAGGVGTAYNPAYALVDEAAAQIVLYINNTDYKFYAELKDKNGSHIANSNIIDLPLESMVVNGSYDSTNKEIVLTLNNGNTLRFSVADLVSGLVSTTDLSTVLLNYVEFTDYANGTNAGVIKTSSSYATETSDGVLKAQNKTYTQYESLSNNAFIGKGTLDNAIAGKELTNKTYVDNADKVFEDDLFNSGYVINEGTDISLDTKLGKPEIELKGNTIQNEVPTPDSPQPINVVSGRQEVNVLGKNLFDINNATINNASYTFENDTLTIQATGSGYNRIQFNTNEVEKIIKGNAGKTLKFRLDSLDLSQFDSSSDVIVQFAYSINGTNSYNRILERNTSSPTGYKITNFVIPNDTSGMSNFRLQIYSNNTATATATSKVIITKPMFYFGEDSSYEVYKGQSYEINLGKNLLVYPYKDSAKTVDGIEYTPNTDGSLKVSGTTTSTGTAYFDFYNNATKKILQDNTTYTFSTTTSGSEMRIAVYERYNNTWNQITYAQPPITFTTTNKAEGNLIRFIFRSGTIDTTIYPQLEKGSQASSFSPYKTPIEVCEINDYKDRIYKENGTWYIEKQIGKIVLDGSENDWRYSTGNQVHYTDEIRNIAKANTTYYCNYYTKVDNTTTYVNMTNGTTKYDGIDNCRLIFKNTSITTANDFKTWLSTHNTIVYYILATPTTTEIIDSELISQLESIELLEGLNNVLISSSGDLPGIIKIKAFSNTTAGSITRLEKIVEFLGDSIGDIGTLLDEIQGEVI